MFPSHRWTVGTAVLSALALQYLHRVAFNLTLTEITDTPSDPATHRPPDVCHYNDTPPADTSSRHREFSWSSRDQGILLGVFYTGYILTHFPGGILADRYGPKRVMGCGVVLSGLCTCLTPLSARAHLYLLAAVRAAMGMAQGVMFPAQSVFVARWSFPHERNMMNSYMNVGVIVGAVLGNLCTGYLLYYLSRWDTLFYLYTAVTALWLVFWTFCAHDSVHTSPFIGARERDALSEALKSEVICDPRTDYWAVLRSVPVWAMVVGETGHDWAFFIVMTLLPQYMSHVLMYDVTSNGLVSSLPYLAMLVVQIVSAKLADSLVSSGLVSKTVQCKVFLLVTNQGPVACFLAASYAGCSRGAVVALFTLSMGFMGFCYSCVRVVNVDLAPNSCGFLMALNNGAGALCGFLGPIVFSWFTEVHTVANWQSAFIFSAVLISLTTVFFLVFGSSEVQPWNYAGGARPVPGEEGLDTPLRTSQGTAKL